MNKNIGCHVRRAIMSIVGGIGLLAVCFFGGFCNFRQYLDGSIFDNDIVYYFVKAVLVFGFFFFGLGLFFIIRTLIFHRDNVIEFGSDHIVDRSSFAGGGMIYYSEIDYVYTNGVVLCIKLLDEEAFLKRQNLMKRLCMRANKKMGFEYIMISGNFLDTDLLDLKAMLDEKIAK